MHNILSASGLADPRNHNGGKQTWERKENLVAVARAVQGNPELFNVQNAAVLFRLIKLRNTPREYRLWILNLLANSDSRAATFRQEE